MPPLTTTDIKPWLEPYGEGLPQLHTDATQVPLTADGRGSVYTSDMWGSTLYPQAAQGAFFVATNPTPLTGIAGIAAADGLDDLEALIFLRNGDSATKKIHLLYLQLDVITGVGTTGSNWNYAIKVDDGASRYASGGSAITPKNVNIDSAVTSQYNQLYFGAVVPTAATSAVRLIDHGRPSTVIKVLGDKYNFTFGAGIPSAYSGIPTEGTSQRVITTNCPPVILGAGQTFLFHEFASSQNAAAQYQFKLWWVER